MRKTTIVLLAILNLSCASQHRDSHPDVPIGHFKVSAQVEHFYRWFEEVDGLSRPTMSEETVNFVDLKKFQGRALPPPVTPFEVEMFTLWESGTSAIVLAVSSRREPGEDWYCQYDVASVIVVPGGRWSPIDLVPRCSPVYGEDEIDFTFYTLPGETLPHISVEANHPACVPFDLYTFDHAQACYRPVRHKCTG